MARKRKFVNKSEYPDHVIERLARTFYPDILASFQSEEGQRAYQKWMKEQQENGESTSKVSKPDNIKPSVQITGQNTRISTNPMIQYLYGSMEQVHPLHAADFLIFCYRFFCRSRLPQSSGRKTINPSPFPIGNKFGLYCFGDPYRIRTDVNGVRGHCLNHLTNGPYKRRSRRLRRYFGPPSGTRTRDPLIKSQLLYQLS